MQKSVLLVWQKLTYLKETLAITSLLPSPGERHDYQIRGQRPTCLLVQSVMRTSIPPTQTWKTRWGEYCLVRVAFLLLYRMKNRFSFCWIAGWVKYTSFCLPKDHLLTICKGTWLPLRNISVERQYSTHWGVQKSERKDREGSYGPLGLLVVNYNGNYYRQASF